MKYFNFMLLFYTIFSEKAIGNYHKVAQAYCIFCPKGKNSRATDLFFRSESRLRRSAVPVLFAVAFVFDGHKDVLRIIPELFPEQVDAADVFRRRLYADTENHAIAVFDIQRFEVDGTDEHVVEKTPRTGDCEFFQRAAVPLSQKVISDGNSLRKPGASEQHSNEICRLRMVEYSNSSGKRYSR